MSFGFGFGLLGSARDQGDKFVKNVLAAGRAFYTLTGQAATLARSYATFSADQGSYGLTGQAATLSTAQRVLSADQGTYTVVGDTMTPLVDYRLPADQGAYALSGQAATLRRGAIVAAGQGSYGLTGQDATLTKSASFTTWNPSATGPDITLSPDKLTATNPVGGTNLVRAFASRSSGKYYYEMVVTLWGTAAQPGMGNVSASLTTYLGSDANGVSWTASGAVWINSIPTSIQTWATGDTLGIAVDLTAMRAWFRTYHAGSWGNWNNSGTADPATGVGGIDISTMAAGPYFPMGMTANASEAVTANFGASAYVQTPPSGFGNW